MRLLLFVAVLLLSSCGSSDRKKDIKQEIQTDTSGNMTARDTSVANDTPRKADPIFYHVAAEKAVNASLSKQSGRPWHVLNDKEASWMKDAFEYFIVPERKKNPNYPYIAFGDYDADGKADTAAVTRDNTGSKYQLIVLLGNSKTIAWTEDITEEAAISTVPKSDIDGMDGEKIKKIRMKGDGINVEYFERAAFVLYWDRSSFKRIQTAD